MTTATPPALDIVKRLRARIEEVYGGHGNVLEMPDGLCLEAADEIDRLRRASGTEAALREALESAYKQLRAHGYRDSKIEGALSPHAKEGT